MEKVIRFCSKISFYMGIWSVVWLGYNILVLWISQPVLINIQPVDKIEPWLGFVWIGFLFFFVYHMMAAVTLIMWLRIFRKIDILGMATLVFLILSGLCVLGDWALLGDIGKEYKAGLDTSSEWPVIYSFHGIHLIFFSLMLVLSVKISNHLKKAGMLIPIKKDEIIFSVTNFAGIICGLVGLSWTIMILALNLPYHHLNWHFVITVVLFLMPYVLLVGFWLVIKRREDLTDLYDEKQWKDVTRAGFFTLLLSIPLLILFFSIFSFGRLYHHAYLMWLPFYLFIILFLFSSFTLYFYFKT